jgi:DNA-directed RNA polymerase subunit beta
MESNAEILEAFKDEWDDIVATFIAPTVEKDKTNNKLEALHTLYKLLRPGDLATDERVQDLFNTTFRDDKRFDLGEIARMKMKTKLGIKTKYEDEEGQFLSIEDLLKSLKYYLNLIVGTKDYRLDDIDHLENRRVRSVGELVIEKLKVGIARMERIAKDRMTIVELEDATPGTFINSRPLIAILKEFWDCAQETYFCSLTWLIDSWESQLWGSWCTSDSVWTYLSNRNTRRTKYRTCIAYGYIRTSW